MLRDLKALNGLIGLNRPTARSVTRGLRRAKVLSFSLGFFLWVSWSFHFAVGYVVMIVEVNGYDLRCDYYILSCRELLLNVIKRNKR